MFKRKHETSPKYLKKAGSKYFRENVFFIKYLTSKIKITFGLIVMSQNVKNSFNYKKNLNNYTTFETLGIWTKKKKIRQNIIMRWSKNYQKKQLCCFLTQSILDW